MSIQEALRSRLVPVAVIDSADDAIPLAETLLSVGLPTIEVTLRTDQAIRSIEAICNRCPDMIVGAGTVLDPAIVPKLKDIGVRFAVSPGLSAPVVEACSQHQLDIMPGVMTCSEIESARQYGLSVLKFFPAQAAGGAGMLKALAGPYGHTGLSFVPTGGIDAGNAGSYLRLESVAAIGGSWFVAGHLVRAGKFDEVARLAKEAVELAQS